MLSLQDNHNVNNKNQFASIYQVGRTMFYFKFYDIQSRLVNNDKTVANIKSNLNVDTSSIDLAYIPWRGTTFWRKTMLKNGLTYIPREFIYNQF